MKTEVTATLILIAEEPSSLHFLPFMATAYFMKSGQINETKTMAPTLTQSELTTVWSL